MWDRCRHVGPVSSHASHMLRTPRLRPLLSCSCRQCGFFSSARPQRTPAARTGLWIAEVRQREAKLARMPLREVLRMLRPLAGETRVCVPLRE